MPYWTFVKIAKEAKANIKLRKTALVDQEKLDKYLEEYYSEEDKRKEKQEMPKNRTTTNDIKVLVKYLSKSGGDFMISYIPPVIVLCAVTNSINMSTHLISISERNMRTKKAPYFPSLENTGLYPSLCEPTVPKRIFEEITSKIPIA